MKNKKVLALMLAATMSLSSFALTGCSDDNVEATTENDVAETSEEEVVETSETTTEETSEETTESTTEESIEETTEATTEETTEETAAPEDGYIKESANEDNADDAKAYSAFMDYVTYGDFPDDAVFTFEQYCFSSDDNVDSRWGLIITLGEDATSYAVVNGEVTELSPAYGVYATAGLKRDDFLKLPIMEEISGEFIDSSEIPDGTYYGDILSITEDGKRAIVYISDSIKIDQDAFESLDTATSFYDINGEEYIITERSDWGELTIVDEDGVTLYGWFNEYTYNDASHTYTMYTDSDCVVEHHTRLCFIDIAEDCLVEDHFIWLGDFGTTDPTIGYDPTEPLTMVNSYYFYMLYTAPYGNSYNEWITGPNSILEPVVISNNQIVEVTLGWR